MTDVHLRLHSLPRHVCLSENVRSLKKVWQKTGCGTSQGEGNSVNVTVVMYTLCISPYVACHDKALSFIVMEYLLQYEPPHDKTNKMAVCPAKTQISLGIRPVWSESLLSAWRKLGSLAIHWTHSEGSEQTGRMPRLIWVFVGRTTTLLVLSWGSSIMYFG